MITILDSGDLCDLVVGRRESRRSMLTILLWSLIGALAALIVMAAGPSQFTPFTNFASRFGGTHFSGSSNFRWILLLTHFKSLPTPTLISIAVPAVFFYVKFAYFSPELSKEERNRLGILLLVTTPVCVPADRRQFRTQRIWTVLSGCACPFYRQGAA